MKLRCVASLLFLVFTCLAYAAGYPEATPGDFVVKDFQFKSGEKLPQVKLHYYTLGTPQKDANGKVKNAVLILHGTTGSGRQFLNDHFAGVLFGPGQLLDAAKYFIILPDNIGHGQSSKPSDGLHLKFPHYEYDDMIELQYRLLTQG
ncbi:MAG: alpha/beta fold hydrolase, partial [Candidatus Angelobacter sp.]